MTRDCAGAQAAGPPHGAGTRGDPSRRPLRARPFQSARARRGHAARPRRPPTSGSTRSRRSCSRAIRTAADYAAADRAELEEMLKPLGFFRAKSDALMKLGQALVDQHGGVVPNTMDELVALPGIGRKTANVILGNAFGVPGLTVDTHFQRLVHRFGWTTETDPVKIEAAVAGLIEKRDWTMFSHRIIFHGRRVCHARKPACGACTLTRSLPVLRPRPQRPGGRREAAQGPARRRTRRGPPARRCRSGAGVTRRRRERRLRCEAWSRWSSRCSRSVVAVRLFEGTRWVRPPAGRPSASATAGRRACRRRLRRPRLRPAPAVPTADGPRPRPCLLRRRRRGPARRLGRPAIINLWASWCAPCRSELPALQRLRPNGPPVLVLGVATEDPRRRAGSSIDDLELSFPTSTTATGELRKASGKRDAARRPCSSTPTAPIALHRTQPGALDDGRLSSAARPASTWVRSRDDDVSPELVRSRC